MEESTLVSKYTKIATVVSAYWFISISLIFVNKYLLSSEDLKLNAPLFVTWFQCVVTVVLCLVLSFLSQLKPDLVAFPSAKLDLRLSRATLPMSVMFVAMLIFNNLCLKYVDVAFYYVGRSLVTSFSVLFTYVLLGQSTSLKALMCCAVIIAGFFLGVDQEGVAGSLNPKGVAFGVLSSAAVALTTILTKKTLPLVDNNVWQLTFYNNLNACLLFLPLLELFGEVDRVMVFPQLACVNFWSMMMLSGVFSLAIGYVSGLQIQVTSPLTHNISGTAKACAQTVIACMYFAEVKSALWWVSNAVVLLGSGFYTEVKRREMFAAQYPQHQLEFVVELDKIGTGGEKQVALSDGSAQLQNGELIKECD